MSETRSSHVLTIVRSLQRPVLLPAILLASSSVLLLSGCGSAFNLGQGSSGPADLAELHGTVHGGQTAVTGATVTLYEIGATATTAGGYATPVPSVTPALPVLGTATTTASGTWSMSPAACVNANDELYLVASGGMPIGNTVANSALVLTAVGGPCGTQFTHSWNIDEVSTVVTEYALSGFSTSYLAVGTSTTNTVGLTHAFATVNNLVNLGLGTAYTSTPAYVSAPANTSPDTFRSIVPNDLINSIANVLATCVNDPAGAAGTGCTGLFALTGGVSTTADAALYVAHNPALMNSGVSQVSLFLGLPTPQAPFGPTLSGTPSDLSMTVNYVGGGLGGTGTKSHSGSVYIAIDQNGNVWIPNGDRASVTELDYLGEPLSANTTVNTTVSPYNPIALGGYGGASGSVGFVSGDPRGVAIDQNGNAWIADAANCLIGLAPGGTPLTGSPFTSVCGSGSQAQGVSVDASNNVWVAGTGSGASFISAANSSGTLLSGFPVTSGFDTLSGFVGADYSGHMWYVDAGNGQVGALNVSGSSFTTSGSFLASPVGFSAFDKVGSTISLWIPEAGGSNNVETATLAPPPAAGPAYLPASEFGPAGTAADGAGNVVIGMGGDPSSSLPANLTVLTSSGTAVAGENPDTGFQGGSGLMSLDFATLGLAIDQSGNVWVVTANNWNNKLNTVSTAFTNSNGITYLGNGSGAATVTEYIGLATPAQPVQSLSAKAGATSGVSAAGAYGVKP